MAKGLFGGLKGVDAFGKVGTSKIVGWLMAHSYLPTIQTMEDVKVKTRTGAFCELKLILCDIRMCLTHICAPSDHNCCRNYFNIYQHRIL